MADASAAPTLSDALAGRSAEVLDIARRFLDGAPGRPSDRLSRELELLCRWAEEVAPLIEQFEGADDKLREELEDAVVDVDALQREVDELEDAIAEARGCLEDQSRDPKDRIEEALDALPPG